MTERKRFLLRLPPKLHEELRTWAEQEMRSLNGQIEYLLREAVVKRRKSYLQDEDRADPPGEDEPAN